MLKAVTLSIDMPCIMYVVTNGCGHSETTRYRNCGGHSDTIESNSTCFHEAPVEKRNRPTSVCMGTRFCNKGCRVLTTGWRCCTCGFKEVHGYYDSVLNMVVHKSKCGDTHAFCLTCIDINWDANWIESSNETRSEITPPTRTRTTTRTKTPSLSYTSDEYESEYEDLFFDASPKPIESDEEDVYAEYNSSAIKGGDLDMIARTFEGTDMSLSPVTTPTRWMDEDEMVYETMTRPR